MNSKEVRDQLAYALIPLHQVGISPVDTADSLMPVVRYTVAQELKTIAATFQRGAPNIAASIRSHACVLSCDNCGDDPLTCDCDES